MHKMHNSRINTFGIPPLSHRLLLWSIAQNVLQVLTCYFTFKQTSMRESTLHKSNTFTLNTFLVSPFTERSRAGDTCVPRNTQYSATLGVKIHYLEGPESVTTLRINPLKERK